MKRRCPSKTSHELEGARASRHADGFGAGAITNGSTLSPQRPEDDEFSQALFPDFVRES